MSKKIYNAPQMKVVEIKNDILTMSVDSGTETNTQYAPGRHGIWDEELDGEDLY